MKGPALAIIARFPSAEGKSRLSDLLTPAQREKLQWCFLLDTLDKVRQIPELAIYWAVTPATQTDKPVKFIGTDVTIINQPAGDLGQRMFSVAHRLFKRGYRPVILIGTDVPLLQPAYLMQALDFLRTHQLILGPAMDGGYYLIGLNTPEERIFKGVSWGTELVFQQTITYCDEYGLSYHLLPTLRDIDLPADLLSLVMEFKSLGSGTCWFPSRTADFLSTLQVDTEIF